MTKEEIIKKYNIVYVDGCRYYIVNLKKKSYDYENTIPYCITINGVTMYDSSWKNLIPRIVEELDSRNPKSRDELLGISCDWSKQCVFGETKKSNFVPYKDIYINANHTAIHAMWIIQLLLKEYDINLDQCEFVIKRQPFVEPKEVREYFKKEAINNFKLYLKDVLCKKDESIEIILKNFAYIDLEILPKFSNGYYNYFFLIENPIDFKRLTKSIIDQLRKILKKNTIEVIIKELDYFYDFIKSVNKENKLIYSDYNFFIKEENSEDLNKFLNDFDSNV